MDRSMSKIIGSGMDNTTDGLNGTSITTSEKNWAALAVLPIVFFVATGNILVILAVKMDHKLRSSTNYFLTSLAVADLLVAITVMPPSLAMIINNYNWPFPEGMCGIWIMLDVCFSTSSILHLCMISLDRYLALAKPFQYSNGGWLAKNSSAGGWSTDKRGNSTWRGGTGHGGGNAKMIKRVAKRIVLVWATSLGIALPLPILGSQDRTKIFFGDTCVINIPEFTIYGSLVAFFLPLIIMFITYSLTIRTLQKQSKLVKCVMGKDGSSHRGRPSMTSSVASRYMPSRSSTGSTKTFSGKRVSSVTTEGSSLPDILCTTENGHKPLKQQHSRSNSGTSRISLKVSYTEGKIKTCALLCCVCVSSKQRSVDHEKDLDSATMQSDYDEKVTNAENKSDSDASETSSLNQAIIGRSPRLTRANMKLSKVVSKLPLNRVSTRRISASVKSRAIATEQRASKVLGMIFILFCVFWCPFFITNAFSGLCVCYLNCSGELMTLMGNLMNWFVWVGYVSSGVNPCVYTLFSKQFRGTFRKLICCQCSKIGQGRLYRSYARDGTTGGFSTSSFHHDFQHSMERDMYRGDSLGRNTLTVRHTNERPLRTFGESIVVRQHRRSQVTRSGDSSLALLNGEEEKGVRRSQSPPNDRLQWRSSWNCILDAENSETPNNSTMNGGGNSRDNTTSRGPWTDYQKRRLFSDPDTSRRGRLVLQDSIPEGDSDEEADLRAAGIARSFTFGESSELKERERFHSELRSNKTRRASFQCGSSDEEDEDNNNFDNNKDDKNFLDLPSTSRAGGRHQETRVRFSPQLRCKACGANIRHTRDNSQSEQCTEQEDNLIDDVFKIGSPSPEKLKSARNMSQSDLNRSKSGRKRTRQLSRFDSGVGESVRNSDSF